MRPLIVGEASNLPLGEPPMSGRTGRALARAAGLTLEELHAAFDRVNLLDRWPGRRPGSVKGHLFPIDEARTAALRLRPRLSGRVVVLLGKRVARAFGLIDPPWLKRADLEGAEAFVIPHPSGVVRWYNEEANRRRVGRLLRRLARRCAESSDRGGSATRRRSSAAST